MSVVICSDQFLFETAIAIEKTSKKVSWLSAKINEDICTPVLYRDNFLSKQRFSTWNVSAWKWLKTYSWNVFALVSLHWVFYSEPLCQKSEEKTKFTIKTEQNSSNGTHVNYMGCLGS